MHGKTCLVTGTTSGIGKETALGLARSGATVLMVARDRKRGETAAAEIRERAPQGSVELLIADLVSQHDVRELATQILHRNERLDVLINNAGVAKFQRQLTSDGVEVTLATNYLGPFLLTHLLLGLLEQSAPARVVNVSSDVHNQVRAIAWDDLQAAGKYSGIEQYAVTKLFNVLFTYQLAKRLKGTGVTVNCANPGFVKTGLGRDSRGAFALFLNLARPFIAAPEKGARTSVYLACSPDVAQLTGLYFSDCKPKDSSKLSRQEAAGERLWELSLELSGLGVEQSRVTTRKWSG